MSLDIWMESYQYGKIGTIDRGIFEGLFLPFCCDSDEYGRDGNFMHVEFPDGGGSDIYLSCMSDERLMLIENSPREKVQEFLDMPREKDAPIRQVGFNHCGGKAFYRAMYELAARTHSLISWSAPKAIYVCTDLGLVQSVPQDSVYGRAKAVLAQNGADIEKAITSG